MTYQETLEYIHSFPRFSNGNGPERMARLMGYLGNPQETLQFLHVAGTNGKGSTSTMLASICRKSGRKTGLYISPYILDFRERMQINGEMIPQEILVEMVETVAEGVERCRREGFCPVEFEVVTAIAFCWFAREQCDVVVLEVGMGGRLDATNIISKPLVSVICTIGFDHTAILGDTLAKIAGEKAGIIKKNGVTAVYPMEEEPLAVISERAVTENNVLFEVDVDNVRVLEHGLFGSRVVIDGMELHVPLIGYHQVLNAANVMNAVKALREIHGWKLSDETVREGIAAARFPARLELLQEKPTILLDGAHNPNGMEALAHAIRENLPGKKIVGVIGMLRDKDCDEALQLILPQLERVVTLTADSPRALTAEELAEKVRSFGVEACPGTGKEEALRQVFGSLSEEDAVVICGSLYLAADLRPIAYELAREIFSK